MAQGKYFLLEQSSANQRNEQLEVAERIRTTDGASN